MGFCFGVVCVGGVVSRGMADIGVVRAIEKKVRDEVRICKGTINPMLASYRVLDT